MYKFITLKLLLLSLLLSGCATNVAKFTEVKVSNDQQAIIYVYRPKSFSNAMVSPEFIIDGEEKLRIKNNSHSYMFVSQGKHQLEIELAEKYSGNRKVKIDAIAGSSYFIRATTSTKFEMNKPYTRIFNLELIEKSQALNEINKTKYSAAESFVKEKLELDSGDKKTDHFSINKTSNPFSK